MFLAKEPFRLLPEKRTSFKSDGSADGNSPLRLFSERSSTVSEVRVWKAFGIEPWMSLFFRLRVARLLRLNNQLELGRTGDVEVEMLSVAEDRKVARGNEKSYLLPLLPVSQLNGNEHKNLVGRAIQKPEIGISPGFGQQQASPEYPESWNESSPHANEERGCSV
nr:hypothetical protein Iba_chr04bCG3110 [Ipomoea batatas]